MSHAPPSEKAGPKKHPLAGTIVIVVALVLGVVLGGFFPQSTASRTPTTLFHFLSKAFISLIKGLVVPLLLVSTIVVGVAQTGDMRAVGRMGLKSLLYFEVVTTHRPRARARGRATS
jgi:proton glutamate symport protein